MTLIGKGKERLKLYGIPPVYVLISRNEMRKNPKPDTTKEGLTTPHENKRSFLC